MWCRVMSYFLLASAVTTWLRKDVTYGHIPTSTFICENLVMKSAIRTSRIGNKSEVEIANEGIASHYDMSIVCKHSYLCVLIHIA